MNTLREAFRLIWHLILAAWDTLIMGKSPEAQVEELGQ